MRNCNRLHVGCSAMIAGGLGEVVRKSAIDYMLFSCSAVMVGGLGEVV